MASGSRLPLDVSHPAVVYSTEGPMFPAQKKDHPTIRILAESCCWTKLMEQSGACGQDTGQQHNLHLPDDSPLPLNQMCEGRMPSVSISLFNFSSQHQMCQEPFNVGDLFVQNQALHVKIIRSRRPRRKEDRGEEGLHYHSMFVFNHIMIVYVHMYSRTSALFYLLQKYLS